MRLSFSQSENIGLVYVRDQMSACSPYGAERLLAMRCFLPSEFAELKAELSLLGSVILCYESNKAAMQRLERLLMPLRDIRRSVRHCKSDGTPLSEVELFEIKRYLIQLREIAAVYSEVAVSGIDICPCPAALNALGEGETFCIRDGYTPELHRIRKEKLSLELELRAAPRGAERDELLARRNSVLILEDAEETRIRAELTRCLSQYRKEILHSIDAVGHLDFLMAKARLCISLSAVMPTMLPCNEPLQISITNMQNPYIASTLENGFTPVSVSLSSGATVITGANMGGKSVALKTLALNVWLANAGMFVFAQSAVISQLQHMFLLLGEQENTQLGLSSFGGEIERLRELPEMVDAAALLLLDEFARGTNPEEGARIVKALVKYLNKHRAISVLSTHYDGVAAVAKKHYRVIGLRDFDGETVDGGMSTITKLMNYGLCEPTENETAPRDAIMICKLLLSGSELLKELLDE